MKYANIVLFLLFLESCKPFATSSSNVANDGNAVCSMQTYEKKIGTKDTKMGLVEIQTDGWQKCYLTSINKLKTSNSGQAYPDSSAAWIYISWQFNDGFIDDSSGYVDSESPQEPKLGDQRTRNSDSKCYIQLYQKNGPTTEKSDSPTANWEGCYALALARAKDFDYDYNYFSWEYNDGYIFDSNGFVDAQSQDQPQKGDQRANKSQSDCSIELYQSHGATGLNKDVKATNNWQDCYTFALETARKKGNSGDLEYYFWKFNDGYLTDSNGYLDNLSSNQPKLGDQRKRKK